MYIKKGRSSGDIHYVTDSVESTETVQGAGGWHGSLVAPYPPQPITMLPGQSALLDPLVREVVPSNKYGVLAKGMDSMRRKNQIFLCLSVLIACALILLQ